MGPIPIERGNSYSIEMQWIDTAYHDYGPDYDWTCFVYLCEADGSNKQLLVEFVENNPNTCNDDEWVPTPPIDGAFIDDPDQIVGMWFHDPGNNPTAGATAWLHVPIANMEARRITINQPSGFLSDSAEESTGAFVPVNDDDDDYTATTTSVGSDRLQSGAINGENDLLAVVLRAVQPSTLGGDYKLTIPSHVRVWTTTDRSDAAAVTGTDTFPANVDTTLYVEGVNLGSGMLELNWTDGTSTIFGMDRVKLTTFSWSGPLNVPGYAAYDYVASGSSLPGGWSQATQGAQFQAGQNTQVATILWGPGPTVSQAIYTVNSDYSWGLDVNVVLIEISTTGNMAQYPGDVRQDGLGNVLIKSDVAPPGSGDGMTAAFQVSRIEGPLVGLSNRGVRFMEMGQVHQARFPSERAFYDHVLPARKRVGGVENYQGGGWLWDLAVTSTIPWTFPDAQHRLQPANDNTITNHPFSTFDSPTNFVTDQIVISNGDTVDRNQLLMEHRVYFAVRTTAPNVNGSADVLTQRLVLNWQIQAHGTWNQANGAWTLTGNGVSGDPQWSEVTNGDQVPVPSTSVFLNTLINTVDLPWTESNQ